jgi:hypothetical protein
MKLSITMLTALALVAFDRVSVAEEQSQRFLIKVADQAELKRPLWPSRPLRGHTDHRSNSWHEYSIACESVIFPRNPLCAGRPATFGPYAPFPWNFFWYY